MYAPTPPSRPQHPPAFRPVDPMMASADARTVWMTPSPVSGRPAVAPPSSTPRLVLRAGSRLGTAVEVVARLGTAVTLAALLVLTATALGAVEGEPMPTGAATTGR